MMTNIDNLRDIAGVTKPHTPFTEAQIRWNVANQHHNGFSKVVVKIGRRVYYDIAAFNEWVTQNSGRRLSPVSDKFQDIKKPKVGRGGKRKMPAER